MHAIESYVGARDNPSCCFAVILSGMFLVTDVCALVRHKDCTLVASYLILPLARVSRAFTVLTYTPGSAHRLE
jgi:hypothetical protein